MRKVNHRRPRRNGPHPDFSLPLFDWAARRSLTPGGVWLYRHRRISPARANLIAELAGIRGVPR